MARDRFSSRGQLSANELRANADYYLGKPIIDRIVVTSYPSVRSAWAEMLRNNIDMLYEVGADAASSMQDAKTVSTFSVSFVRINTSSFSTLVQRSSAHQNCAGRLNAAIDRAEIVRDGFDGHATPCRRFGLATELGVQRSNRESNIRSDGCRCASESGAALTFSCLVPTDYERVALVVQRQLAAVGVTMNVEATTPDRAFQALTTAFV